MMEVMHPFLNGLFEAVSATILISVIASILGTILGVVLLIARTSGIKPLKYLVVIFVSGIRGIPLLIQLLVVYYAIPGMLDITITPVMAGIATLALNTSAYVSEILRGALTSIPLGQRAAGFSLGMKSWQIWRYIILPQLFLKALPPLTNEFTVLLKASSLLSIIAVNELSTLSRNANLQTNSPLTVFLASAAVYFVILFIFSTCSRRIEQRFKVRIGLHD